MNTQKNENQIIVNEYLHQIEEKLPGWLKENPKERQSIINEIEEHIWDKAEDLAQEEVVSESHLYQAIQSMGTPDTIAKEYRKRGTPHIFISKEWWPYYKKVIGGIGICMIGILIISIIYIIRNSQPFWDVFTTGYNLWSAFLTILLSISIIFIALSWEGFLPRDLKEEGKKHRERYHREHHHGKKNKSRHYINWDEKLPLDTKHLLSSGIWEIIWAIIFIIQPFQELNLNFTPAFLSIIIFWGILDLCGALIKLAQVFAGMQRVIAQRIFFILTILISYFYIPLSRNMLADPEALQVFSSVFKWGWNASFIAKWILYFIIFGSILKIIAYVVKLFTYEMRLNKYIELKAKTTFN
ncbi:HAAS signaling domain-containing protein [Candidatus Lokiarchaeum ossiferum]|uniref:HAAS signaling domain-containing protein n=1 Tax=Candidatus Lokiarchaeum ossiferum TaxID=2951803 RepID=UPI00352EFBBA